MSMAVVFVLGMLMGPGLATQAIYHTTLFGARVAVWTASGVYNGVKSFMSMDETATAAADETATAAVETDDEVVATIDSQN